MWYAQYLRIESRAGGVFATDRQFIKACHSVLKKSGKVRAKRDARHAWIRAGLAYRVDSMVTYREVMGGAK